MPKILVAGDSDVYKDLERIFGEESVEYSDNYCDALKIANKSYDNFIIGSWLPIGMNQKPQPLGIRLAKDIARKFDIPFDKIRLVSSNNDLLIEAKKADILKLYSKTISDDEHGIKSVFDLPEDMKKDLEA